MKTKINNFIIMKHHILFLMFLSLAIACGNNTDDLNKDIAAPVSVKEIVPGPIQKYVSTSGTVYPLKEVSIKNEISGKYRLLTNPVTKKPWALGDRVNQGTTLVVLENREFENSLKIDALQLKLDISRQVYDKQKSLYEKGGVTLSELKNAEVEYINSKYAFEDAQIAIQKVNIKAPFSGVIVDLPYYTPNTKIETGSVIVKMMDYSQLQLEMKLAEKNFPEIEKGQLARIMNYTLPEDTLKGTVSQISPAIDPESRTFKAILMIENPGLKLQPGMFAKAEIIISSVDSAIVIPKSIILSRQKGNVVFVVNKGLAEERLVNFGIENPDEVQIVSGLSKSDRVVVKGFETLRNRSRVKEIK
jgi:membrane fusion protein, multidrug efflux system